MRLVLVALLAMLAGIPEPAQAQVDTLRIDTSGATPTLYLRDSSLSPGVTHATTSGGFAVVRQGPAPSAPQPPDPAPPRRRFPVVGVLLVVAIVGAVLTAVLQWAESARRRRGA